MSGCRRMGEECTSEHNTHTFYCDLDMKHANRIRDAHGVHLHCEVWRVWCNLEF